MPSLASSKALLFKIEIIYVRTIITERLQENGDKIYGWLNPESEIDERPGRNIRIRYNLRPTEPAFIVARRGDGVDRDDQLELVVPMGRGL